MHAPSPFLTVDRQLLRLKSANSIRSLSPVNCSCPSFLTSTSGHSPHRPRLRLGIHPTSSRPGFVHVESWSDGSNTASLRIPAVPGFTTKQHPPSTPRPPFQLQCLCPLSIADIAPGYPAGFTCADIRRRISGVFSAPPASRSVPDVTAPSLDHDSETPQQLRQLHQI
jgi:hypothetical protein